MHLGAWAQVPRLMYLGLITSNLEINWKYYKEQIKTPSASTVSGPPILDFVAVVVHTQKPAKWLAITLPLRIPMKIATCPESEPIADMWYPRDNNHQRKEEVVHRETAIFSQTRFVLHIYSSLLSLEFHVFCSVCQLFGIVCLSFYGMCDKSGMVCVVKSHEDD